MNLEEIGEWVSEFSQTTHGSTDFFKEELFVLGEQRDQFAPFKYLCKKIPDLNRVEQLLQNGYSYTSSEYAERQEFRDWYEKQFSRKLTIRHMKNIFILNRPNLSSIFSLLEEVDHAYKILREEDILLNSKNLPVQVGEWFAKSIFGMRQVKSTSQRGFDFYLSDDSRVEVKIHWKELSSPKGVKLKKSLVDLSDFSCVIYLNQNFLIRDICFLDSPFVMRKFAGKGHTIFLKDQDLSHYFFSKSSKHFDKVQDKTALMKFSSPTFAMKLDGRL